MRLSTFLNLHFTQDTFNGNQTQTQDIHTYHHSQQVSVRILHHSIKEELHENQLTFMLLQMLN